MNSAHQSPRRNPAKPGYDREMTPKEAQWNNFITVVVTSITYLCYMGMAAHSASSCMFVCYFTTLKTEETKCSTHQTVPKLLSLFSSPSSWF